LAGCTFPKGGTAVANPSKDRGTRWESRVVTFLRENGHPYAERRALAGNKDLGDIGGIPGLVIECKNTKAISLAQWMDEAIAERDNAKASLGVVVFPRRNHSVARAYVVLELQDFARLIK
jgi:hypothetical protein